MIHDSPSHLYHSALKFPPSSSWLHQYYSAGLSKDVKVIRGLSAGWGTCFRTVLLDEYPEVLVCWKDTIAVGLLCGDIITLNAVTGSKIGVLSEHTNWVTSFSFSPDGTSLVSGSEDKTIKLWDMQTGGVVKTFHGHDWGINSVSISVNCTTIASGSLDRTIRLWDIQTGECHCVIEQESWVEFVYFSPLDPQHVISVCNGKVQEWNIDGHKIGPGYDGHYTAFSLDGTMFVFCNEGIIQVQGTDSRAVISKFHIEDTTTTSCYVSPDERLIAIAADHTVYVWDFTSSEPCLIETFVGHTRKITSLVFLSPTSLISASNDNSVKFWQIGASSTSPDVTVSKSILHTSSVKSITLQAKDGIAISSDSDGVVRIWNLSTGHCKASFQTPAKGFCQRDVQLINNRLILVWYADEEIHIWDVEKGELLQKVDTPQGYVYDLRISGDGSKVFWMAIEIHAWYIWTGEAIGSVSLGGSMYGDSFLATDSSRAWVHLPGGIMGWDFGVPDSFSIMECTEPPKRPHLDFVGGTRRKKSYLPGIEDTTTGREFFQLPSRYANPNNAQWDGQYLVAGYDSGEVLILECNCTLAH
jgi:WD40 repeat protein